MRCIVTGGAGFLGSHLCESLLARGHDVCVVDDLFRGRKANMEDCKGMPDFHFVLGDCADIAKMEKAEEKLNGVDVVYHLAAINGTRYFNERPDLVISVNLRTTDTVVKFASERGARLVFTSSPEAYGIQNVMPLEENAEGICPSPHSHLRHSYGASKYLGEILVQYAVRERGLDGRIVRPFNGYGPRLKGGEHGQVSSIFLQQCHEEKDITLHGDGEQTRCFTWYSDLIDGIVALGELDEGVDGRPLRGSSFNIGSKEEVSIRELAEIALKVSGSISEITSGDGHPGDTPRRVPDTSAAEAALGWQATVGIEEGMHRCWEWMLAE